MINPKAIEIAERHVRDHARTSDRTIVARALLAEHSRQARQRCDTCAHGRRPAAVYRPLVDEVRCDVDGCHVFRRDTEGCSRWMARHAQDEEL